MNRVYVHKTSSATPLGNGVGCRCVHCSLDNRDHYNYIHVGHCMYIGKKLRRAFCEMWLNPFA